ncbi:MAG: hypothetical protein FJ265_08810, partial [Planctomycetes bacterium]|nr:hypothetical protein [Planctomycetota bacterium]
MQQRAQRVGAARAAGEQQLARGLGTVAVARGEGAQRKRLGARSRAVGERYEQGGGQQQAAVAASAHAQVGLGAPGREGHLAAQRAESHEFAARVAVGDGSREVARKHRGVERARAVRAVRAQRTQQFEPRP